MMAWRLEYVNPITGGSTLPTLSCWIQLLRPGEHTKKHRHTSSAVYFVVGGEGTTIVDGKAMNWTKNDCFAVPNWAWHEHVNRSKSEEALLFSVNDTPIVSAFGHYREEPENIVAHDVDAGGAGGYENYRSNRSNRSNRFNPHLWSSPASRGRMKEGDGTERAIERLERFEP